MRDTETDVWLQALASYGSKGLLVRVSIAVDSYKRAPGLSARTRLYASSIGVVSSQILWEVLQTKGQVLDATDDASQFVSVRLGLRVHLHRTLQARLLKDGFATQALEEDFLAWELGL